MVGHWLDSLEKTQPSLKAQLEMKLGELLQLRQQSFDYFEKRMIENKINAIETLLEVPRTDYSKFSLQPMPR